MMGRPTNLDNIRARAYCAFIKCVGERGGGWGGGGWIVFLLPDISFLSPSLSLWEVSI